MGQDQQAKHRQIGRKLTRQAARRAPYASLLIVCEGEKTEPLYLQEIRQDMRLSTANVHVCPSAQGTEPAQVLAYAERLLLKGEPNRGIAPKAFDEVFVVFDRDEHHTFHQALTQVAALSKKHRLPFHAIASVPCFELWLLLHFEPVYAPLHRTEALARLKQHLPHYAKAQPGLWAQTQARLSHATACAQTLGEHTTAYDGIQPCTAMHQLVARLLHLKD